MPQPRKGRKGRYRRNPTKLIEKIDGATLGVPRPRTVQVSAVIRNQVMRLFNNGMSSNIGMDFQDFLAMRVVCLSPTSGAVNGFRCIYQSMKINRIRLWSVASANLSGGNTPAWIRLGTDQTGYTQPISNELNYFESFTTGIQPAFIDVKPPKGSLLGNWFGGGSTMGTGTASGTNGVFTTNGGTVPGAMLEFVYDAVLGLDDDVYGVSPPANQYRTRTFLNTPYVGMLCALTPVLGSGNWEWADPYYSVG